ncbi:MAG TPA: PDZ domain-containing protein [Tepidisphaeraceae bacterium]|nr:PDZ domain-containing protein [Tepidisphaeraceae bacterium]
MNSIRLTHALLLASLAGVSGVAAAPRVAAAQEATTNASSSSSAEQSRSQSLYERVTPSLVAVQYVWENELGRQEINGAGIVVAEDGLVMTSLSLFDIPMRGQTFRLPDAQMKEFKILVPSQQKEAEEVEALFAGRDDRTGTAFIRAKSPQKWTPLKFEDVPVNVGDEIASVGVLPKNAAYKTYLTRGSVGATLRGELPQVLVVGGNLAAVGSPVFNAKGQAIGLVNTQPEQSPFLNDSRVAIASLVNPPIFFVPTWDFAQSISDPPVAGKGELKLPWMGVPQQAMAGLNKDVAESLGLKDTPAVEIGDVIAGSPIDKAGLKAGSIIVKVNGKPLERGDEPEELPGILARQIRRMKVGDTVTLSILTSKDQPPKDVEVKLTERPRGANLAERWYVEDLGFGVREMVFMDSYVRKLPQDTKGAVVSIVKPQSAANAAKLQTNDLISELNGQPISNLADLKTKLQAIRKERPKEPIVLVVLREANTQTIRIEPPQ